jgi:hypothetical protein
VDDHAHKNEFLVEQVNGVERFYLGHVGSIECGSRLDLDLDNMALVISKMGSHLVSGLGHYV